MSEKVVSVAGQQVELALERSGASWRAGDRELEVLAVRAAEIEIRVGGREHVVPFVVQGSTVSFAFEGEIWFADVVEKGGRARARHRDHSTGAPMPGVVLRLLVKPGDRVSRGTPLVILEAMKMEHQIVAPADGVVVSVNCAEGELVQPGVDLVDVEGRD